MCPNWKDFCKDDTCEVNDYNIANTGDQIRYYQKTYKMSYKTAKEIVRQTRENTYSHYIIDDKTFKEALKIIGEK